MNHSRSVAIMDIREKIEKKQVHSSNHNNNNNHNNNHNNNNNNNNSNNNNNPHEIRDPHGILNLLRPDGSMRSRL